MTQQVFEFGDKNGRLLVWLAKGQFAVTHIGGIKGSSGELLTSPDSINYRFLQFYQELYSSRVTYSDTDLKAYLDCIHFPTLDSEMRDKLNKISLWKRYKRR